MQQYVPLSYLTWKLLVLYLILLLNTYLDLTKRNLILKYDIMLDYQKNKNIFGNGYTPNYLEQILLKSHFWN